MTKNGVCNFLDGGATDPFGIATALASGANEIFCVNAIPDLATVQKSHFGHGPFDTFHIFKKEDAAPTEQDSFISADGAVVKNMLYQTFKVKTVKNAEKSLCMRSQHRVQNCLQLTL